MGGTFRSLTYAVLFEDEDLLAVAKPSGLPTLPGAGYLENTLLTLVRRRTPGASPVHRLGRGTSGVVLFARTPAAMRAITEAWREHRVTKIYRALATGTPELRRVCGGDTHRAHPPSATGHRPRGQPPR